MALYRSVRLAFRLVFRVVFRWPFRRAFRSAGLAAVVVFGLGLAACGSGPGDAVPSGSSSSGPSVASGSSSAPPTPDSRPTPASSKGPARNLTRPVLPEVAKQNTKEGFAAFTQYWFDTITYGLETGDSGPLREISLPDCKMCNGYAERAEAAKSKGEWGVGPEWNVQSFQSNMMLDPLGQAEGLFFLEESSSSRYSSAGSMLKTIEATRDESPKAAYGAYRNGVWKMSQVGRA